MARKPKAEEDELDVCEHCGGTGFIYIPGFQVGSWVVDSIISPCRECSNEPNYEPLEDD